MAAVGDTVIYVTRVAATRKDPRGMGIPGTPDIPANYGELPALVGRVLSPTRLALAVIGAPVNFLAIADEFAPLTPKWGTWKAIV